MAGIAMVAAASGASPVALTLAGAIEALRKRYPALSSINEARYARCLLELERTVSSATRKAALVEGGSLSLEQAIETALAFERPQVT